MQISLLPQELMHMIAQYADNTTLLNMCCVCASFRSFFIKNDVAIFEKRCQHLQIFVPNLKYTQSYRKLLFRRIAWKFDFSNLNMAPNYAAHVKILILGPYMCGKTRLEKAIRGSTPQKWMRTVVQKPCGQFVIDYSIVCVAYCITIVNRMNTCVTNMNLATLCCIVLMQVIQMDWYPWYRK